MKHLSIVLITAALAFTGCSGDDSSSPQSQAPSAMTELNVPDDFTYQTSRDLTIALTVTYPGGAAASGIPVSIFRALDEETVPSDDDLLHRGITDSSGMISDTMTVPSLHDEVTVVASVLGVSNRINLSTTGGELRHTFQQ